MSQHLLRPPSPTPAIAGLWVSISTKTPLQPWHVFMRIDPDNKHPETNENNNIKKATTTLTVQSS